ncbi:MAG: hypothetical protein HY287_04880 [Planctomycetes bacterium]|nr:hypothetical protein [Planctomycetota bacterium]MBI3833648.1 hypothetical protein [Planctomycetota bacterium]
MFNHDWFHGPAYSEQQGEARWRCAVAHFPNIDPDHRSEDAEFQKFGDDLHVRTLIYLRDGFSYEIKEIADVGSKAHLVFECMPVDEQYKVGAFVVSVPFEEIVRVEVFAVHPNEKPEDVPQITGFRNHPEALDPRHADGKNNKPMR